MMMQVASVILYERKKDEAEPLAMSTEEERTSGFEERSQWRSSPHQWLKTEEVSVICSDKIFFTTRGMRFKSVRLLLFSSEVGSKPRKLVKRMKCTE